MMGKRVLDTEGRVIGVVTEEDAEYVTVSDVEHVSPYGGTPIQAATQKIPKGAVRHTDEQHVRITPEYLNSS